MIAGSLAKPESASLGVRMPVAASASSVSIAAMSMRIFSLMNRISVTATIATKMICSCVMGGPAAILRGPGQPCTIRVDESTPGRAPGRALSRAARRIPRHPLNRRLPPQRRRPDRAPYSSTYVAPPSPPTLIRNATVLTGTGTRIDGGDVLIDGGKIEAVGQSLAAPEGAVVIDAQRPLGHAGPHRRALAPGRVREPRRRGLERRQRGDRPGDRQRLGRAQRLAAGPGLRGRAAGRRHVDADPARLREPDRRARRHDQERAGDDLPGHEIPRRAAGTQDGLRREPEARLRRRRPVPLDPHGQRRRLPPGLRRREGLHGRLEGVRRQAREVRQGKGRRATRMRCRRSRRSRTCKLETLAEVMRGDILVHNHCYRADEMATMLDIAKEFGFKISAFHHGVEAYKIAGPARRGRRLRRALGRLVGLQDGSLRRHPGKHRDRGSPGRRLRHRAFGFRGRHPAPEPGSGEGHDARQARGLRHPARARDPLDHVESGEGARHPGPDRHARARQDGGRRGVERHSVQRLRARRPGLRRRRRALRPLEARRKPWSDFLQ